jgi:arylsulfatase A-like enzyme
MSLDEQTFADVMGSLGYTTGMVGKWHLGQEKSHHPLNRGFDEFFGVLEGGSTFIDSSLPSVEYASIAGEPGPTTRPNKILRGFDEVKVDRYLTDVFTDEAVDFVDRNRQKPFFLYLSHTTPHTPLQATADYLDRYRHIEDDRWKLIKYNKTNLKPSDMQLGTGRLPPPKAGWSADSPLGQITLLYDLDADPGETRNLAADHPEIVKRLQTAYDEWSKGLGEPIIPALRSTLIQIEGENIQLIF